VGRIIATEPSDLQGTLGGTLCSAPAGGVMDINVVIEDAIDVYVQSQPGCVTTVGRSTSAVGALPV
jgi:hypothetical protein